MATPRRQREQISLSNTSFWTSKVQKVSQQNFITPRDRKRIAAAFSVLKRNPIIASDKSKSKKRHYQDFLRMVQKQCGDCGIVVSVIGIGSVAIEDMKESTRKELPTEIARQMSSLKSPVLEQIAQEFGAEDQGSARPHPPLGSYETFEQPPLRHAEPIHSITLSNNLGLDTSHSVFELTWADVQAIVMSQEPQDKILLFEPHSITKPFIHFKLDEEQCEYYTARRKQIS